MRPAETRLRPLPTEITPEFVAAEQAAMLEAAWQRWAPARFRHATLDQVAARRPKLATALRDWLALPAGDRGGLGIVGPASVGKTFAMFAVLRELYMGRAGVGFVPSVELFESLRPDGGRRPQDWATEPELCVDDLGADRLTDWAAEQLYGVVNRRWLAGMHTSFTSNLNPAELRGAVGPRIYDRLVDGATLLVVRPLSEPFRAPQRMEVI